MTTAEKLQRIIEAQVKGGCKTHDFELSMLRQGEKLKGPLIQVEIEAFGKESKFQMHILEILLDPQGLRAAYGEAQYDDPEEIEEEDGVVLNAGVDAVYRVTIGSNEIEKRLTIGWHPTAHKILDTWLSSNGDAEKTISTAFNLLPPKE